ncbi:MAG: amino acid permease [Chitinophagaceae bacterium]|nr:amino acid permease [Chitinophagaceae bacterium]
MNKGTQKLNLFSLTMIIIGFVIGMGIFRTAATSAKDAITPAVYFSAWAIGGLVALCGALTYAEIGSRYPVTGGYYKVFAKAYHPVTQNILMMIKITMVIVLISALFFPDKYAVNDAAKAVAAPEQAFTWIDWVKSLGISLIAVSFTYGGYQQTINLGNDVHNPSKNIPRGIFIGILIIIGLYMLVNLSYFNVVGFNQMKGEKK